MWLAIDKAWNTRMNVPGMSKGMFAHRTAGELLFTGYKDVLLFFQGTQFVRRLVDGFEGQVQGLVPPVINDNNVTNPAGYVRPLARYLLVLSHSYTHDPLLLTHSLTTLLVPPLFSILYCVVNY